jgi:transposase
MERAELGEIILVFTDPMHPTHNTIASVCWQEKGAEGTVMIKSNSGRKRLNVLGALNPISLTPTALLTEDNCDTAMMEAFLVEIRKEYPNMDIPIVAIFDNAKYNLGAQEKAKELNIIPQFLPPYCPNLNLIERVWKFYKKEIQRNHYYETYQEFFDATMVFFQNFDSYHAQLESLLSHKFEIIKAN